MTPVSRGMVKHLARACGGAPARQSSARRLGAAGTRKSKSQPRRPAARCGGRARRSRASAPARRRGARSRGARRRELGVVDAAARAGAPATSSRMRSPVRTSASGPPTAASGAMCSTMVPKAVPLMRASEMRTMSLHALLRELLRDRQVARLRHARRADRAGVAQHQHVVGRRRRGRGRRCARARSSTRLEDHARGRVCCSSVGVAADCLMTAPRGARLPRSTAMRAARR